MKYLISVICLAVSFISSPPAFSHPGGVANDGCHYCRTNCDKWGVPWNERHCHGSRSSGDLLETHAHEKDDLLSAPVARHSHAHESNDLDILKAIDQRAAVANTQFE